MYFQSNSIPRAPTHSGKNLVRTLSKGLESIGMKPNLVHSNIYGTKAWIFSNFDVSRIQLSELDIQWKKL